jgi:ATP-binding cassette, subfamily F, member 3
MITATNLFLKYGDRVLMDSINVVIKEKDKLGLVGRNGAGKSTFLKILAGEQTPDSGQITRPSGSSIGFLHQEMTMPKGKTVIAETLTAFDELKKLEHRIEEINIELGERVDYESNSYANLIDELSHANERFVILGGVSMEAEAEKILQGLGFKSSDMNRMVEEFSGGWQMRIELAKMLLARPDYLLLDEPTNHLDIESILWLESFLKDYPGAVVLISHDKLFLDNITKRTVEIELGKVYDYKAPYSKYLDLRAERKEKTLAAFKNQQGKIAQTEKLIEKFRAKASKAKMAQSLIKQLDKIDRVELDSEDLATMRIKFPPAPRSGDVAVKAKKLSKSYGNLQVLNEVSFQLDRGDRVAFVGQNGQGKTTLAKILVKELMPSGGDFKLGHNIHVGYYAQNQSDSLQPNQTLLQTMEDAAPPELRTKVRSILGAFMFSGEDAEKKVMVLSGGERARLALACLLLKPINFLVLDEPTNHLDILSKEVLKNAVQEYDGTLIVVSHDRDFLKDLTSRTFEFRDKKLHEYLGDVNFFLEKRKLEDMRAVEMKTAQKASDDVSSSNASGKPETPELSHFDRKAIKKLEREVQNAERKIEDLESKIKKIEIEMGAAGFYQSAEADSVLEKYNKLKEDLEKAMSAWETATENLESY